MSTFTSQTQLGPVQVKSYWSTLADLFASCCGARDKDKTQYERLLDQQEDSTQRKLAQSSILLRWLALLISGQYLPDNQQIYAVLFRLAGVLDGLAASGGHDSDDQQQQGSLGQSTKNILNETQALLKDIARWFTADDAVIDQTHIPNGNSRHQLQRIVFHSSQLMRRSTVPKPDIETAKEIVPEVETLQKSAEQAIEDLRLALYSTAQIGITLLTCDQLLDAIRDSINFARDVVADAAQATANQVSHVEAAVRPTEQDRTEPAKDQAIELKQNTTQQAAHLKQGANQVVAQAAQINTANIKAQVEQIPEDLSHRAREKLPSKDSVIDRVLTVVQELIESDDSFREAIQSLLALARKYASAVRQAAQGVVPQELVVEGASETKERQPTPSLLESNPHITQLLLAGKEFLEGLAGGKSLDPVLRDVQSVWSEIQSELLQAFDDWLESTSIALDRDDGDVTDKASLLSQSIRSFIDTIRGIVQSRQDLQDQLTHIQQRLSTFAYEITRETRLRTMARRLAVIKSVLASALNTQTATLTQHGRELLNDTFNKILPSLLHLLGSIPLPRIEFTSPQLDAALDDLTLAAVNLIPAAIRFEAKESFEWNRTTAATTTLSAGLKRLRVEATGFRLAFQDVSFFVREKVTQTSNEWLNWLCCAIPHGRGRAGSKKQYTLAGREEEGHLGAYREAGLVDLGLFGEGGTEEGAGVVVEVQGCSEEGQDEGERDGFFKVTSTSLTLSDSFKFHLHDTHHRLINTLLVEPIASPAMRLVIQYAVQSLLKQALQQVDGALWDYHQRAVCVAGSSSPGVKEYARVVLHHNAGKSAERIRREEEQRRLQEQQQQESTHDRTEEDTEGQRPKVELKPMALILNPTPDLSISIGAYPSLLPTYAQGSSTHRVAVRNAVVQDEWRSLVANRATETLDELSNGVQIARESQRAVAGAIKETVKDVKESTEVAEELRDTAVERRDIAEARAVDEEEDDDAQVDTRRGDNFVWYHDAFDL